MFRPLDEAVLCSAHRRRGTPSAHGSVVCIAHRLPRFLGGVYLRHDDPLSPEIHGLEDLPPVVVRGADDRSNIGGIRRTDLLLQFAAKGAGGTMLAVDDDEVEARVCYRLHKRR